MIEGDSRVVDWQTWEDNLREPPLPGGMTAGPWFPFAAFEKAGGDDYGARTVVVYRRPLVKEGSGAQGARG